MYNGVYDGYDALASSLSKSLISAVEDGNAEVVNTVIAILMVFDNNMRFNMKHGMWTVGVETPFELITKYKDYTIKDIAQNIKCPTLVLDAEFIPWTTKEGFRSFIMSKEIHSIYSG